MSSPSVLIVPAYERGRGGGHLSRSLLLHRSLQARGFDAYLWIPAFLKDDFFERFSGFFKSLDHPGILSSGEELAEHTWAFIVLDRFRTTRKEFNFWADLKMRALKKHALEMRGDRGSHALIGIDEGGPCRKSFDFLIDLLPSLARHGPNVSAPSLLPLPMNRRPKTDAPEKGEIRKILISFGVEDDAGLGVSTARKLSRFYKKSGMAKPPEITLVTPVPPHDSHGNEGEIPGVKVMGRIPGLMEHFAEYDLLITHFGIGAFEAVYARIPVLLISPTRYHARLARAAGFESGVSHLGARHQGVSHHIARRFGLEEDQDEDLGSFIGSLAPHSPGVCPACGRDCRPSLPALARSVEGTFRRCHHCGVIFPARLKPPFIVYEREYFFSAYKNQYGKTYLEDFANLKETGRKRLAHIFASRTKGSMRSPCLCVRNPGAKPSLLDIGCAYGPFLAAAAEEGFTPMGIEPVDDAVRYVKEELGFKCWQGFFPAALPEEFRAPQEPPFDVITLWYVIEHFEDPGDILREIYGLLKNDGELAFSTPSFSGISGRKSLRQFLMNSPPDHYTVWSPRSCGKILRQFGFGLRKIVVTGHHPERFPLVGRFVNPAKKGPLYRLLLIASHIFRLGDTFEAYAVKREKVKGKR